MMTRITSIPVDVREAIGAFLDKAQGRSEPLATSDALDAIRRIFPDLEVSDNDLIDAITSEAVASNVRLHIDVPRPDSSSALERGGEGGATKKQTDAERRDTQRRVENDTDGTRRRAKETQARNRLI